MKQDVRAQVIEEIEAALRGGRSVAVATVIDAGKQKGLQIGSKLLVRGDESTLGTLGDEAFDGAFRTLGNEALVTRPRIEAQTVYARSGGIVVKRRSLAHSDDARLLVEVFEAPGQLIIVGGGHVGLALATIGVTLGFQVTVVDDREEFANVERFPMADRVIAGDIEQALASLTVDRRSYVVMVSRGHQLDELALRCTVSRGAAYVGMIGSRRRTGTVLQHLAGQGVPRSDLDAVRTPIGLDIGAETPEEIALAILAEMVLLQRGGTARAMSEVKGRSMLEQDE
jgi:xanthine dehydrogenase accessory factor